MLPWVWKKNTVPIARSLSLFFSLAVASSAHSHPFHATKTHIHTQNLQVCGKSAPLDKGVFACVDLGVCKRVLSWSPFYWESALETTKEEREEEDGEEGGGGGTRRWGEPQESKRFAEGEVTTGHFELLWL